MNIFYLDNNPYTAAKAMTDKHVIKMILESAQLLSTAHHVLCDPQASHIASLYKPTHSNHPSAIWARESEENYFWLYDHFVALCQEYTKRYNKVHLTETKLKAILSQAPQNIPQKGLTPLRIAITNSEWHKDSAVASYRAYYVGEKLKTEKDIERYYEVIK